LNGKMNISIFKITKENEKGKLIYQRLIDPSVTKELRLYVNGGADNIFISNNTSPVTIRIVGDATSNKNYHIVGKSKYLRKIHVYGGETNTTISGQNSHIHHHFSNDNNNVAMQLTDRYNKKIPLLKIGYNVDDGLILGGGLRWINKGFRKQPYASIQEFSLAHSFSTGAYKAFYEGEWLHIFRNTDFVLKATAAAPDNTQNFYGRGNNAVFDKTDSYKTYYRTRFDYFTINPAFRWRSVKNKSFSIGPSYQSYHYDPDDNLNRFITKTSLLHSYDSATISKDKSHLGIVANFTFDSRSSLIMPKFGSYINVQLLNYLGLNKYSKSYTQLIGQMAFYKSIGRKSGVILTNRTGGGITAGSTTFYQSLFLGGQSNLQGYSQYRYAGDHMLYNNTEIRIKLANFASYILPGQIGLVGFYDIGKVWQKGNNNSGWHSGTGGGLYFSPAQLFVFQFVIGKSNEGWYPYLTAGFRF
jgi:hypothetical protein